MHLYFLLHSQVPHQGAPRASLVWTSHFIAGWWSYWYAQPPQSQAGSWDQSLGPRVSATLVVHTTHWTRSPAPMPHLLMKGNKSFSPWNKPSEIVTNPTCSLRQTTTSVKNNLELCFLFVWGFLFGVYMIHSFSYPFLGHLKLCSDQWGAIPISIPFLWSRTILTLLKTHNDVES